MAPAVPVVLVYQVVHVVRHVQGVRRTQAIHVDPETLERPLGQVHPEFNRSVNPSINRHSTLLLINQSLNKNVHKSATVHKLLLLFFCTVGFYHSFVVALCTVLSYINVVTLVYLFDSLIDLYTDIFIYLLFIHW